MPLVTYVLRDGSRRDVEVASGMSVMKGASEHGIAGIDAECGGCLSCATCHVYVDPAWADKLPPPTDEERIMVDCALDVRENSRLSCQLTVTDELNGLVVQIPASQT